MRGRLLRIAVGLAACAAGTASAIVAQTPGGTAVLPVPGFHHVHLNSPNPEAAITEYLIAHPSNTKTTVAGLQGFKTSNNVYFLFNKVANAPAPAIPDKISPTRRDVVLAFRLSGGEHPRKSIALPKAC